MARVWKSAILILMDNSVAGIAAFREQTMANMPIKLNAQFAAMSMEQMDLICMKSVAPRVKGERLASGTGEVSNTEIIPAPLAAAAIGLAPLAAKQRR
jgi:hypothetical protein